MWTCVCNMYVYEHIIRATAELSMGWEPGQVPMHPTLPTCLTHFTRTRLAFPPPPRPAHPTVPLTVPLTDLATSIPSIPIFSYLVPPSFPGPISTPVSSPSCPCDRMSPSSVGPAAVISWHDLACNTIRTLTTRRPAVDQSWQTHWIRQCLGVTCAVNWKC